MTTNTFDPRDRLTGQIFADASTATFTYDATGNILTALDGSSSYTYTYNVLDRRTQYTDNLLTKSVSYTYDKDGRLLSKTAPEGDLVTYAYDAAGRPTELTEGAGNATYTYDAVGNRLTEARPNGVTSQFTYDARNLPLSIAHQDPSANVLQSFAYTLDALGRVSQVNRETGEVVTYAYDALGRITQETGGLGGGYTDLQTFDANGAQTQVDFGFGNIYAYTYDARNRLTNFNNGFSPKSYTYDVQDRLIKITPGSRFMYGSDISVGEDATGDGNMDVTCTDEPGDALGGIVLAFLMLGGDVQPGTGGELDAHYARGDRLHSCTQSGSTNQLHQGGNRVPESSGFVGRLNGARTALITTPTGNLDGLATTHADSTLRKLASPTGPGGDSLGELTGGRRDGSQSFVDAATSGIRDHFTNTLLNPGVSAGNSWPCGDFNNFDANDPPTAFTAPEGDATSVSVECKGKGGPAGNGAASAINSGGDSYLELALALEGDLDDYFDYDVPEQPGPSTALTVTGSADGLGSIGVRTTTDTDTPGDLTDLLMVLFAGAAAVDPHDEFMMRQGLQFDWDREEDGYE